MNAHDNSEMMLHEHGGEPSPKAHAKELGHHLDRPDAKPHGH